jgi:hypothetical protein
MPGHVGFVPKPEVAPASLIAISAQIASLHLRLA